MKSCLQSLVKVRGYLLSGALLIMAASLLAASGIYTFTLNSIDGKPAPLADYKGKVALVVKCCQPVWLHAAIQCAGSDLREI
jgi:hypothetical protein